MVDEQDAAAPETQDPMVSVQNAIAATADDGGMLAGFVVVAEWIESDGSQALSVFHSPMPPWHLDGLLKYARTFQPPMIPLALGGDWCDDDEDDEDAEDF